MKKYCITKLSLALAASAAMLGTMPGQAQTFITTTYTNNFDLGANTASFSGSGSVHSWIYWYNTPGGNTPMTCVYGLDANNATNTSGCLEMDSPFGTGGTQNVMFGTFGNNYGYDFSVRANLLLYSNITFDIKVPNGTIPNASGNFGTIGVGIINAGYGYEEFGRPTIPGAASNGWVHISVPINYNLANLANVPGLAFNVNNYSGYPQFFFTNYIDNLRLNLSPVQIPPPILSGSLGKPMVGLNEMATQPGSSGQQYDRYQIASVNDTGYGFNDQPSVTYSWNIAAFPQNTGGNFQQHFFMVNGAPGAYDQSADYNLAQCIFITVQQSDAGVATMNFRYKTNQPAGNGMLFNGTSPTNTAVNTNGWPIQPVCSLSSAAGAVGTWSVTFANATNVTLTAPNGATTNFVFDAASAALFADPVTLILGGQPNNTNGLGKAVVYNSFSATGCDTPISENFAGETTLSSVWKDLSNDPNGDVLVPAGSAYWLNWSLPDAGFSLQTAPTINGGATNWADLTPVTIQNNGSRQALIAASSLPLGKAGYFRLIERTFSKLQVLFPGETNAPNTATGKTGTPATINSGDTVSLTVNAVDATYHPISGVADTVHITTTDGSAIVGRDAALVNGTGTFLIQLNTSGPQTVSATDTTNTNIPTAISTTVNVN